MYVSMYSISLNIDPMKLMELKEAETEQEADEVMAEIHRDLEISATYIELRTQRVDPQY